MGKRSIWKSISPMLATLVDAPFNRKGWIFEIKWDGYRALAFKHRGIQLMSRRQKSFKQDFPSIVASLKKLPGTFVIDGEIVILDQKGRPDFQLLQNRRQSKAKPYYYLFDILWYNGNDLTQLPLLERKKILQHLLYHAPPQLRYSEHVKDQGKKFFRVACKAGLEGILAKNGNSSYQFHRSKDWLKIKTILRQEVVIGGFTAPKGQRSQFGALLVGVYQKDKLIYSGHVGGGFDEQLLADIYLQLQKLITSVCPFAIPPHPNAPVTWVKPKLVCEVAFKEWTQDAIMRQPIFKGLRPDKHPEEVVREIPLKVLS
jgi:bifunctional non-homologous end joining protein LigD